MVDLRVLIVDDSPTEVMALSESLEKHGISTVHAHGAEDGIAAARRERPDIILMDIVMPGVNGFQATRQLSRHPETAPIPVIVISSKGQDTDRIWAMRQGAKGYLVKPVEERELLRAIQDALAGSVSGPTNR